MLCLPLAAQTFEISPQPGAVALPGQRSSVRGSEKSGSEKKNGKGANTQELGWGSSIEVARESRAAEDALRRGDYGAAANFAQRAAKAAPQDTQLWLLLGYAARMSGNTTLSVAAYEHGLQLSPNSVEGLSGLAQTYVRMGRSDDARKLLLMVLAANPSRPDDLNVAGELFLQSGEYTRALQLLQRAESVQPSSRTELLMALAYQRNQQPGKAKELLELAR
ncbi:MAG TPA: tetratricopeptide repeat protein, partial [Terriglobales bacterium]|nr:tetratricopeptide repeat protein [Terriglobales bacterium]